MSDTTDTPESDPTTGTDPSSTADPSVADTPPSAPAAAPSSRRGIWKYLGAGAIGLVVGALAAGLIAWGVGDDHDGRRDMRPAMSQQRGGGQMPQMPQGPGGRGQMPGGQMPGGQKDQQQSQQQGQTQQGQAQPWGSQGGMGPGGRTRAS